MFVHDVNKAPLWVLGMTENQTKDFRFVIGQFMIGLIVLIRAIPALSIYTGEMILDKVLNLQVMYNQYWGS